MYFYSYLRQRPFFLLFYYSPRLITPLFLSLKKKGDFFILDKYYFIIPFLFYFKRIVWYWWFTFIDYVFYLFDIYAGYLGKFLKWRRVFLKIYLKKKFIHFLVVFSNVYSGVFVYNLKYYFICKSFMITKGKKVIKDKK